MAGGQGGKGGERGATARRQDAASARRKKEVLRRNAALGVVAVVLVALLGVCFAQRSKDQAAQDELVTELTAGDCDYDTRTDSGGSEHVENPPAYKVNPPSGGTHTPQAAAEGIYEAGQVPPDGPLVHAQEHGYVVIWYKPGDQTLIDEVEALGEEFPAVTLVVPRASMDVPVAATAWHRRLLCGSFDKDALTEFIRNYQDKGPEKGFIQS